MEEKKKTPKRRKKKKSTLADKLKEGARFEVLFVGMLLFCFFVWGLSKCSKGSDAPAPPPVDEPSASVEDVDGHYSPAASNTPNSPTYDLRERPGGDNAPGATTYPSGSRRSGNVQVIGRGETTRRSYTPLYVTLQDLKVRRGPSRDSAIVAVLNLHEEVMFMEKRTNFSERINIGNEVTNEPWIYIQNKRGNKGWVYGAGVHYFKWDRLKNPIRSISEGEPED